MSFEDGFKDVVHIFGASHATGRNDADELEYKVENIRENVRCRIRRKEKQQTDIKAFFTETKSLKAGDLVFSIESNEMFQVETVKPVYGKQQLHHRTCILNLAPNMAKYKELIANS